MSTSIYTEISSALNEVFTDVSPSSVDVYNSSGILLARSIQVFVAKKLRDRVNVEPHVKFIFRADELKRVKLWSSSTGKNTLDELYTVIYESITYRIRSIQDFGKVEGYYVATIVQAFEDFFTTVSVYRSTSASSWTPSSLVLNRTILAGIVEVNTEDSMAYVQRGIEVSAEMFSYWSTSLTVDEIVCLGTVYYDIKVIENVKNLDVYKKYLMLRRKA